MNDPSPRSLLRVRYHPHLDRARTGEILIEVVRAGKVVATIYGSREGLHIVTDLALRHQPFLLTGDAVPMPGWVFPLIAENEDCPWCGNRREIIFSSHDAVATPCPVCKPLTGNEDT
jgi:hypothetical protein